MCRYSITYLKNKDVYSQVRLRPNRHPHKSDVTWASNATVCKLRIIDIVRKQIVRLFEPTTTKKLLNLPDSKVHGANMGPTWVLSAPCWAHKPCYQGSVLLVPLCVGSTGFHIMTSSLSSTRPSPCAEMTRKLPVSLIHAACVLEMFVSVVPVREHFATPFTLVTFTIWSENDWG